MSPEDSLLDVDPLRDLSLAEVLATSAPDVVEDGWGMGMHTATGTVRLAAVVSGVEAVLAAGLPRHVAVWTLLGGLARLERDRFGEYADTVVRETLTAVLEPGFAAAGFAPVTDEEVNEVALLLAERNINGLRAGYLHALTEATGPA